MKHEKSSEVYVATPMNVSAIDIATELLGQCDCAVFDDLKDLKTLFIAHDADLSELMFTMAEQYNRKKVLGSSRAFKVKVSVTVEELNGK